MSRYFDTAREIYLWLDKLQIKQETIAIQPNVQARQFRFSHPVEGQIEITLPEARDGEIVTSNGIAFRINGNSVESYDVGGIFDPVDGRVQGEHYSATHFALLAATLFSKTGESHYLESAKLAIGFHLRTAPSEYQPMSEWMYHWDFQNYAFILTYKFLFNALTDEERKQWKTGLKSWRTNYSNRLSNWAAMRAWVYAERFKLFKNPIDKLMTMWNLRDVYRATNSDGCIDDNYKLSRPIQYHIFTAATMYQIAVLTDNRKAQRNFDKGVEYFLPFIAPDGCFNYLGRGHEQIFGYGAAIYALEAANSANHDKKLDVLAKRLFDYLLTFQRDGGFPLVLNNQPDSERPGWYDYHHLTVYNAFLGAWLALADLVKNDKAAPDSSGSEKEKNCIWYSEPTQMAIVSRPEYYAAFYGGLPEYLCEATITPHHIWWRDFGTVFSCPGGPTLERFGKRTPPNQDKNFLAPIAKNGVAWHTPAHKAARKFEVKGDMLSMIFDFGVFELQRDVRFLESQIIFEDFFQFTQAQEFEDFRLFNFPVSSEIECDLGDSGMLRLQKKQQFLRIEFVNEPTPFERLETTTTARGVVQIIAKRKIGFSVTPGSSRKIAFKLVRESS